MPPRARRQVPVTDVCCATSQISLDTAAAIDEICKTNKLDAQRTRRELFEAQREALYAK